ncbi:MAG TPA: hypothetical protein VL094_09955 [Sphingomonadaceae bacterium]|nr:hypothetical protein [Sphingomonadaceae bacterium]
MSNISSCLRKTVIISLKAFGTLVSILAVIFLIDMYFIALSNSTRSGPLRIDNGSPVLVSAHELLSQTPVLRQMSDDSLRFAAMPSFGRRWFAVALSSDGKNVRGWVVILDRETGTKSKKKFSMEQSAYARMMIKFDDQADGYWGEARGWTDGTSLAFERNRGGRIVSGVGNSPCHYAVITNVMARGLSRHLPSIAELIEPEAESYSQSEHCDAF